MTSLYGLGNYTQAIQWFNKASAIDPNYKVASDNKQAALSKTSPQQPQKQQQNINESRVGPAPSPSPYAAFNSSGLICHYITNRRVGTCTVL